MYKTHIDSSHTHTTHTTHTHTHKHTLNTHPHTEMGERLWATAIDTRTSVRPSVRHLISLVGGRVFRRVTAGSMWFVSRFGEFFFPLSLLSSCGTIVSVAARDASFWLLTRTSTICSSDSSSSSSPFLVVVVVIVLYSAIQYIYTKTV